MRFIAVAVLGWALLGPASTSASGPDWQPCPDRADVECARLEVPLDHDDPLGRSIALPMRRLPAADPERRLGVLVTVAGGPGQRGTDWVRPELHDSSIRSHFDIVGFDPRGTSSDTAITCIPAWDPYGDLDRTPDDAEERAALDDRTRDLALTCQDAHGEILAYVGTADTVLDIERLRLALGEDQLSLLGSSYGSEVALRYSTAHPHRTRSVVLDGYRDPNLTPVERELEQAAAFERELDELLVECALGIDCPIEGREPGVVIDRLLEALDIAPIPAGVGLVLRQSDAYEAIAGALVRGPAERWQLLEAIAAADDGDGTRLRTMADRYRADFEASGLNLGTFMAITCADDGRAWSALTEEEVSTLTERIRDVAPRLGPWLWSPSEAEDMPPVGLCAMTPADAAPAAGPFDGAEAGPILVLAASGDPTTPMSAALRGVDELQDAALVAVRADGHLVYPAAVAAPASPTGRCVLEAMAGYLFDGTMPVEGVCP